MPIVDSRRTSANEILAISASVFAVAGIAVLAGAISEWHGGITLCVFLLAAALAGGLHLFTRQTREQKEKASALSQGPFSWSIPVALIAGLSVVYAYRATRPAVDIVGVLFVAGGAAVVGVFIGFLFGIPRLATRRSPILRQPKSGGTTEDGLSVPGELRRLNPNTNLEEISDWLTKIIVGITLYEAKDLLDRFDALVANVATVGIPKAAAGAIVIYFSVAGFLAGYLWTRLVLTRQFAAGDRAADIAAESSPTALADVFVILRQFLATGAVQAAVNVGRDYLQAGMAETAGAIFLYLKEHASPSHSRYFAVLSNLGYSYIDQKRYDEAVAELQAAIEIQGLPQAPPWHAVALAYAYYMSGQQEAYREWLDHSRRLSAFSRSREELARRYPEVAEDLLADQQPAPVP